MGDAQGDFAHAGRSKNSVFAGVLEVDQLDLVGDILDIGETAADHSLVLIDVLKVFR